MNEKPAIPLPIRATPYQHQIDAFNFAVRQLGVIGQATSPGVAFLMEMGTGKTLTSIAVLGAMFRAGMVEKALIVCPLSITGVWYEELAKFAAFAFNAAVLTGPLTKKADTLRRLTGSPLQIAVVNYESAWRMKTDSARRSAAGVGGTAIQTKNDRNPMLCIC